MKIPEHIIQEISSKIDIVDVVGDFVSLRKQGGRYWGRCPFHDEKTPSFTVTPEKNLFYCFGCHKGGTVFNFLMEMENLSFVEATERLAKKAGVAIPKGEATSADRRRNALIELYTKAAGSFHYILENASEGEKARTYLDNRGLNAEIRALFQLGYIPRDMKWLFQFLKKKNFSEGFLKESGLFIRNYPRLALLAGRIIFPIQATGGQIIAFGGRNLEERGPKYLNTPETAVFRKRYNLYGLFIGLSAIRKSGAFILVEGYIDVMALHLAGISIAIAPLGTAFTREQANLIKRYAEKGYLLFDGDNAGQEATKKAIYICEEAGIETRVIELPEGADPADILKKEGIEALHKIVKCHINSFNYLVQHAVVKYDVATPEGKEAIIHEIFPFIDKIDTEVKREACLQILADEISVDQRSVLHDYIKGRRKQGVRRPQEEAKSYKLTSELFLMIAIAVHRNYFPRVRSLLTLEDLEDQAARSLYIALEECYRREDETSDGLFERIEDDRLRRTLLERIHSEEFNNNPEQLISDSLGRIKQMSLEKRRIHVEQLLKKAQDGMEIQNLLEEKIFLDEELERLRDWKG